MPAAASTIFINWPTRDLSRISGYCFTAGTISTAAAAVEETAAASARPPMPMGFNSSQHITALMMMETRPE